MVVFHFEVGKKYLYRPMEGGLAFEVTAVKVPLLLQALVAVLTAEGKRLSVPRDSLEDIPKAR